jgi:spore germination protein YaaH
LSKSDTGWNKPDGWEQVLEKGKQFQLKTEMTIYLNDQNHLLTSLLANQAAVQQAIAQIMQESKYYQGVNLDFEGLGLTEKGEDLKKVQDRFTNFVRSLDEQLLQSNKTQTLTLHPLNSAYQGYDYQALGQIADHIIIMAYEYGSNPEPIDKVREAVELAQAKVPSEKLILGILIPNETPQSVLVKVGIAKRYNLGGIALWRLGVLSDEMWNSLRSTIKTRE